jgi:hypothetical protein
MPESRIIRGRHNQKRSWNATVVLGVLLLNAAALRSLAQSCDTTAWIGSSVVYMDMTATVSGSGESDGIAFNVGGQLKFAGQLPLVPGYSGGYWTTLAGYSPYSLPGSSTLHAEFTYPDGTQVTVVPQPSAIVGTSELYVMGENYVGTPLGCTYSLGVFEDGENYLVTTTSPTGNVSSYLIGAIFSPVTDVGEDLYTQKPFPGGDPIASVDTVVPIAFYAPGPDRPSWVFINAPTTWILDYRLSPTHDLTPPPPPASPH